MCLKCRCRLTQCPICSADFVKAKNIMLAQIAEYIKYPCPNTIGGCDEVRLSYCPPPFFLRYNAAHSGFRIRIIYYNYSFMLYYQVSEIKMTVERYFKLEWNAGVVN